MKVLNTTSENCGISVALRACFPSMIKLIAGVWRWLKFFLGQLIGHFMAQETKKPTSKSWQVVEKIGCGGRI